MAGIRRRQGGPITLAMVACYRSCLSPAPVGNRKRPRSRRDAVDNRPDRRPLRADLMRYSRVIPLPGRPATLGARGRRCAP